MSQTLIVLPCYNEAARLSIRTFTQALEERSWLSLLFVDDGSTDGSASLLATIAARSPRAQVLNLSPNQGKAVAVHKGLAHALASDAATIGYWDSDLATPFEELDAMLAELDGTGAFMVMGSRVRLLGRDVRRRTTRHYVGRLFATAASLALDLPVYDTQCGAKLFRNDAVARAVLGPPFRSRWMFDVEILARLARYDEQHGTSLSTQAVFEHPLRRWSDVSGSKVKTRDGLRAGLDIARIALWRRLG
ncbi:MAG: glycosyltransferase [Polyangia bacterium]|jgi:glycosyltransferase involved in cell wall biosynthesis|nr:glycosyltransferase [Polyangia bacterium]